jgi:hypothetical protein
MSDEALAYRPAEHIIPIGWLAWHIARVEDMHVADLLDEGQLWTDARWHQRFDMPPEARDFGTRQTLDQVNAATLPAWHYYWSTTTPWLPEPMRTSRH